MFFVDIINDIFTIKYYYPPEERQDKKSHAHMMEFDVKFSDDKKIGESEEKRKKGSNDKGDMEADQHLEDFLQVKSNEPEVQINGDDERRVKTGKN